MSFTKQQIVETANYIAGALISSNDDKTKKWFCGQFTQAVAQHSLAKQLMFSRKSEDFAQLLKSMHANGINIPQGFQVSLFNTGTTTVLESNGVQFTIYGVKKSLAQERFDLTDLKALLNEFDDEQSQSSEEEGWEAEFRAPPLPMLNQFIRFNDSVAASSVEVNETLTLSPRQKIASI